MRSWPRNGVTFHRPRRRRPASCTFRNFRLQAETHEQASGRISGILRCPMDEKTRQELLQDSTKRLIDAADWARIESCRVYTGGTLSGEPTCWNTSCECGTGSGSTSVMVKPDCSQLRKLQSKIGR